MYVICINVMRCNLNEIRNLSKRFFCRICLIYVIILKIFKFVNLIE